MENIINKVVLFDYFAGQLSPLQKKAVENWLGHADNHELYYRCLHEWELAHLQAGVDWRQAFARTSGRIHGATPTEPAVEAPPQRSWWQRVTQGGGRGWAIAASVALVLGLTGGLLRDRLLYQTVQTGYGEVQTVALPDGSEVTLNGNSSLRYPRFGFGGALATGWGGDTRTVALAGEADFAVRHLPNHRRFVVQTANGLTVTVLGTQFTVFSRSRGTRVVLHSGRVVLGVRTRTGPSGLTLRPGELATLGQNGRLTVTSLAQPQALSAWKQHRLTFDRTPLREISAMLHDTYGLRVSVATPDLADRTISGSFPARNADEIIAVVAELLAVNYHRDGNRVVFTD